MKKLLLIMSAILLSGSSYAGVSGSVGVDFSENTAGDVVAAKDIDIDLSSDVGFASIAVITNANDELVLDEYALGVKYTNGSISYGGAELDFTCFGSEGIHSEVISPLHSTCYLHTDFPHYLCASLCAAVQK